jgi:hypothetical protein
LINQYKEALSASPIHGSNVNALQSTITRTSRYCGQRNFTRANSCSNWRGMRITHLRQLLYAAKRSAKGYTIMRIFGWNIELKIRRDKQQIVKAQIDGCFPSEKAPIPHVIVRLAITGGKHYLTLSEQVALEHIPPSQRTLCGMEGFCWITNPNYAARFENREIAEAFIRQSELQAIAVPYADLIR